MRIQILSDLHLDLLRNPINLNAVFSDMSKNSKKCDLLVIAGDLAESSSPGYESYISRICSMYKIVLLILGNHDWWNAAPDVTLEKLKTIQDKYSNLKIMRRATFEIDGFRFVAATMWFGDTHQARVISRTWSDFHQIKAEKSWIWEQRRKDCDFLSKEVKEGDIVITHHVPLFNSLDQKHLTRSGDLGINAMYLNDQSRLISKRNPKIWIHGHTHVANDYTVGGTRIICNPMGYKEHGDETGYKTLIIEV